MSEEEDTCKISVPLISDYEIRQIDNYFDDIVHQFTKQLVHDKDLAIAQYIIQKQQEEIEKKDKIIDELEDKINLIETYYDISDLDKTIKEDA